MNQSTSQSIFQTSFVSIFNAIVGIFISVLIARTLGVEILGEYALLLTFSGLILSFGCIVTGGYEILIGRDERLFSYLNLILFIFLIFEYLFIGLILNLEKLNNFLIILNEYQVVYYFVFAVVFNTYSDGAKRILNGRQYFYQINLIEFISMSINGLLFLFLYLNSRINISSLILMVFLYSFLRAIFYLTVSIYTYRLNLKFSSMNQTSIAEVISIGARNFISGGASYIPKILMIQISSTFSNSIIGLYKIGSMFYEAALIIPGAASSVLRGKATSNSGNWNRSFLIGLSISLIYLFGSIFFFIFGDQILYFIFGSEFIPAKNYVVFFIVIASLASFYYILESEVHGRAAYPIWVGVYAVIFLLVTVSLNNLILANFVTQPLEIFPFLIFAYFIWLLIWIYIHRFYKSSIN